MRLGKAVVTGATGFIGAALVRRLLAGGCDVVAAAPARPSGWARLSRPSPGQRLRQLPLERLTRDALLDAVGDAPPDAVFHLASAGVNPRERAPDALLEGNAGALVATLEAAARWGGARVVFTGSCSEYSAVVEGQLVGEAAARAPADLYGAAKAAAHDYGRAVARALSVPLVTLRLFGVYGPGEAPHRLIPYLAARLRAGERVDLTPGTQLRDLTFVDDVVEALLLGATTAGLELGAAYNVCSGRPTSVREVCLEVARQLGAPESLLDFGARPPRADELPWLVGDPGRFCAATSWQPRMPLSSGVAAALAAS
ncbi:NDP-sugar oxidoreductase [Sorangium cellulosum]|uniref:NDP-sugar oxidoreductase n=1 Tax=Sorangium cellulosum TaxID=56 RepID=A0A150SS98_SORCE|nr:NDP-sugar oxidoreductase [Sorangium cellulosum]KYF98751.1 NDP-sugar oxidoreductase [Sorangium cellulosum]